MSNERRQLSTALITGASRGIGPTIAHALAELGFDLALAARSAPELESVAADLRAAGHGAIALRTDLTHRSALEALVRAAEEKLGGVDVLVNNAGGDPFWRFHNYRPDDVDQVFRLNALAPIELTRLLLPRMLA